MNSIRKLFAAVESLFHKRKLDAEMEEEMRSHVEQRTQQNLEAGMSAEEARYAALRQFGWVESIKEECRDQTRISWIETSIRDVRFGVRMLGKNPVFTAVAVLTLALGIGAATALFSVVYGVLISPYPYAKPGEIWVPGLASAGGEQKMRPYPTAQFSEMAKLPVFADVMATAPGSVLLTGEYAPQTVRGVRLSGNAFNFIGVRPQLGRTIQAIDITPAGDPEPVTVISFRLWQKLFGGQPDVLGKTLRLDDQLYTVIGVMPSRFGWWTDDGLWLPFGTNSKGPQSVFPITRLKPGVTSVAAESQLHTLQLELAKIYPSSYPKEPFTSRLTNYLDLTVASGEMQRSLRLIFGAVIFLLLIACANVANLQLAKATVRAREMAVRLSLGAGRGQLIRQLLTESILVSILGGLLGLLFAYLITHLTVALMPGNNVPAEARIEVNRYVLSFSVIISALTGIIFGLAPALQSSRPNLVETLKDEGRGSSGLTGGKTRGFLVITEVALSVVLLISAALTIRSFVALQQVKLGFLPERVMTIGLPLAPKRYPTPELRNRFARELLERVRGLPGVAAASIGNGGLPFGGPDSTFGIEGQEEIGETRRITLHAISGDYLRTLGIPLRHGRMLEEREINELAQVAVINEAAARLWPAGENPIGRRLRIEELLRLRGVATNITSNVTIVGIIGNTRNDDLREEAQPTVLIPYTLVAPPQRMLAVRTLGEPTTLMNALREQVRQMDSEQPINGPTTFEEILGFRTAQPRFIMALFTVFAALGLGLAIAGIYSVLSYLVQMRTREFGVRLALGAQRRNILALVFRAGGRLVGFGIIIGIVGSLAAARVLQSQLDLFRVTSSDPLSFAGMILLLIIVAGGACFIPARRATRVEPVVALRYE
ncbi:MAG: hypothetical protein JWM99_3148 [Verrucomicrobiales bacterium]|nr:hypothetical protein [Verrucomicrobiales bacterium]